MQNVGGKSMKELMMIVGSEILDNDWMELTLVPLTLVKPKKKGLMDLVGGDIDTILNEVTGTKQHKTKMYMRLEQWGNMGLKIGRHVAITLEPDNTSGGVL